MSQNKKLDRRAFLKQATGLALGAAAFPTIIPSSALGKDGAVAPSNRIGIGMIGVGGMGTGDMQALMWSPDAQIVAVCDLKPERRENAARIADEKYGKNSCAKYEHFWEMLARKDIDAVSIASNDHWHVLHALAAVRAGKDLYVEKPLGMSLNEIFALRQAVNDYGRVFQFGTQQRSTPALFRQACELVRNGRIGKVHTIKVGVHAGAAERSGLKTYEAQPIPEGFDYDLWLGPAPVQPFHPKRIINPHWFHISDYSLGYVSGWGVHHIDIAQWGNGTELTGPLEIEGTAQFPHDDALCDNPVSWDTTMKYANGVTLCFTGTGPGFEGVRHGITFEGSDGWIWVNREGIEAHPASLLKETIGPEELHLKVSTYHQFDFMDSIRSRQKTICPIDVAVRSDTVCQLAWIAFHLQRKLRWDPVKEEFIGDAEANGMMHREMRGPWRL